MRWLGALMVLAMPATAFAQESTFGSGVLSPQAGLAIDWTTGPTFGDVPTVGGTHGLGIEGRLALFGAVELDARYEMLSIALPADMGTARSHQVLGQLKVRWVTDDARRQLWAIGGGYGTAFRPDTLGDTTTLGRISLTRQFGIPNGPADLAFELAYEHSFDASLDLALASFRFGLTSGPNAKPPGPDALFAHTTSLDLFAPGGIGVSLGIGGPRWSLETSANYIAGFDIGLAGVKYHGFDGAQWAAMTGPRFQVERWPVEWAPLYAQVQAGAGWIARDPGELRPVQSAEVGVRAICSSFGADFGVWIRTQVDGGTLDPIAGGLALRLTLGTNRIVIGGDNRKCADAGTGGGDGGTHETHTIGSVSSEGGIGISIPALPAPRIEVVTPRPGQIWITGHWEWHDGYEWVGGRWEAERANMRWVPGTYQVRGSVHVWVEGHWTAN